LDPFDVESFVSNKLLGFGDVRRLMGAMKSAPGVPKSQEELMKKMSKGEFALRDMCSHFQSVMNMVGLMKKR
jgi:signal recognition particle GTPase